MTAAATAVNDDGWNGLLAEFFAKQAPAPLRSAIGLGFSDAIRAFAGL